MIRTLTDRNLLILTLYFIGVAYILYRATNSVQDRVRIKLVQDDLNRQLEAEKLKDNLGIGFKLLPEYRLDNLESLSVEIQNKSSMMDIIYIDWDRSSLTDLDGKSRRIIRIIPGMTFDLFQPQAKTFIGGGQSLKVDITTEDVLKRGSDNILKISSPLFALTSLKNGRPEQKKKYSNFMSRSKPLEFALTLVLEVNRIEGAPKDAVPKEQASSSTKTATKMHIVNCNFVVDKEPWLDAVSWKPRPHPPLRS